MSEGATRRGELSHLAELTGLAGLAVAQPVVSVFGDAPEHFAFRGASSTAIVLFPLLVALVPPLVLWIPGAAARMWSADVGQVVHSVAVGALLYLGSLHLGHEIGLSGGSKAIAAVAIAGFGLWVFHRYAAARSWAQVMAVLPLLAIGLFLFSSPAGDLAFADPPDVVELTFIEPTEAPTENAAQTIDADAIEEPHVAYVPPRWPPDIVMIVLDELPVALLLDSERAIDRVRYPNVAAFADDATWYRRTTTVSEQTKDAIPAILSGRLPTEKVPGVWTSHPDNLFRLLGGAYHLVVSEGSTKLCADEWCGTELAPPPPREPGAGGGTAADTGASGEGSISTTSTAPSSTTVSATTTSAAAATAPAEGAALDRGGLSSLLGDAWDVWRHQVALNRVDTPLFEGFEETVVAGTPQSSSAVGASTTTTTTADMPSTTSVAATSTTAPLELESVALPVDEVVPELGFADLPPGQVPRVDEFRAAIGPSDQPTLYYLHLVLPHSPFVFTETGAQYVGPQLLDIGDAEWAGRVQAARMGLQMQFTDRLVGSVLDDLRRSGVYDDALVILLADHGASFDTSTFYRYYDGTNAAELMAVPLIAKLPGQSLGGVSDVAVQATDVLPTIADYLGVTVPWLVDGQSILADPLPQSSADCADVRNLVRMGLGLIGGDDGVEPFDICANEIFPAGLQPLLGPLRSDDEWATAGLARLTPFPELLGLPFADLDAAPPGPTDTFAIRTDLGAERSAPVGVLRGTVGGDANADWVAVAVNGRVVGISPVYDQDAVSLLGVTGDSAPNVFTVLLPTDALNPDGYDVRVATLTETAGGVRAVELQLVR